MGMATGHMDVMDDILLPLLVTRSLPRPVAFIYTQMCGYVHTQQLRSHITQTLAKETTGSTATHSKIDLVKVWNSLSMFRKRGPQGHRGHLFPAELSSGHLSLCSLEQ